MKNLRIAKILALGIAALALAPAAAFAGPETVPHLDDDPSAFLDRLFPSADPDPSSEPSPAEPSAMQAIGGFPRWSIGGALGILGARGADSTSIFGEVEGRFWLFDVLAVKLAGSAYRATFQHHDIVAQQYPVTLNLMWTPIPRGEWSPYVVAGAGWYYTKASYHGTLEGVYSDSTSSKFGYHGGAGLEWIVGSASFYAEGSYVLIDPKVSGLTTTDFNHWQALLGLTFRF